MATALQTFVPSYLEMSMDAFSRNQEDLRTRMRDAFSNAPGYALFEEGVRKNMELYNQTMKMFSPLTGGFAGGAEKSDEAREIDSLKSQLSVLQKKLEELESKGA